MLRALILILLPTFITGCLPEEESDDIVNDQGNTVSNPTLRLNGLWNGQFDQAGVLRALIYNGTVFAFGENAGYYGTADLDERTATAGIRLSASGFTNIDAAANQFMTGGSSEEYVLSGLLYPTQNTDDTVVGDYQNNTSFGGFAFQNDGTWNTSARLARLKGKWITPGYELYLTAVSDELSFREISLATPATGCTTRGSVRLIDEKINLYSIRLVERKNCPGFNVEAAFGYTTIDANGELELFLKKDDQLFYARYAPTSGSETMADTTEDGMENTADETTEEETPEVVE